MTRVSSWAWAAIGAAVITGLYVMAQMLAVFWLARSMVVRQPKQSKPMVLGRTGRPSLPLDGALHVLHPPTHGGPSQPVLLNREPWQRSVAADACVRASTLHQLCAQRYDDMSPAAKESAGGAVLAGIGATLRTLTWAQHPADLAGVDDGFTPVIETVRDIDDTYYFAFIKEAGDIRRQVVAALQQLFTTDLQKAQIAALCA